MKNDQTQTTLRALGDMELHDYVARSYAEYAVAEAVLAERKRCANLIRTRLRESPINSEPLAQAIEQGEHKRAPTARRDGIAAWLRDQIEYLESIGRTSFGDGALSAYKSTLTELER